MLTATLAGYFPKENYLRNPPGRGGQCPLPNLAVHSPKGEVVTRKQSRQEGREDNNPSPVLKVFVRLFQKAVHIQGAEPWTPTGVLRFFSAPGRMRTPKSCESNTERQQDAAKKKEKKERCAHRNFGRLFSEGKLPEESPGAGQAVPAAKPRGLFTER